MKTTYKLGSLFDGSGGFPLAGALCDITPVWASEVEPYPVAVTKSRFQNMKHLGNIRKINGAEIAPVDVITFGFPCQDVSVAGKRKGAKHEDNGDNETTRSGLVWEAIRITKEMRGATNGKYPRFAVFENVPGLFSAEKGETFRTVIEGLIQTVEPTAVMPEVPKKGWAYADVYCGDGWSFAYRVFDAQYIRTAQRRRRVYAVLDFGGRCAPKVLFERESLRGYFAQSGTQGQGASADAQGSVGADDREGTKSNALDGGGKKQDSQSRLRNREDGGGRDDWGLSVCYGIDAYNQQITGDVAMTLRAQRNDKDNIPCVCYDARGNGDGKTASTLIGDHQNRITDYTAIVCLEGNGQRPSHRGNGYAETDKMYTLNATEAHGVAYEEPIAIDRAFFNQGQNALYEPQTYEDGTNPTIVAKGMSAVCYSTSHGSFHLLAEEDKVSTLMGTDYKDPPTAIYHDKTQYIVRRLTPTECARLQGFPDKWGHIDHKDYFTDEEYEFWCDVYLTFEIVNERARPDGKGWHEVWREVKPNKRKGENFEPYWENTEKPYKHKTVKQMLTWYNKLHTDSAEYKMWGNGIALPCALYVMEGIVDALNATEAQEND